MATTLEIINGISQVLANSYDGALDSAGNPVKIGLRREEGDPLIDERVMDGFGVQISGDRLHIKYHCEPLLKEVHSSSYESEIDSMVEKVKKFIQKEFKSVTGSSLSLTEPSEVDILVEYISRVRVSVKAHKCWKIGSLDSESVFQESEEKLDSATKRWLELGGLDKGAKKPRNVTAKSS